MPMVPLQAPALSAADMAGLLGAVLYMASYTGLAVGWLRPATLAFFVVNLAAASLVLISLTDGFNYAALALQTYLAGFSLLRIAGCLRRPRPAPLPACAWTAPRGWVRPTLPRP